MRIFVRIVTVMIEGEHMRKIYDEKLISEILRHKPIEITSTRPPTHSYTRFTYTTYEIYIFQKKVYLHITSNHRDEWIEFMPNELLDNHTPHCNTLYYHISEKGMNSNDAHRVNKSVLHTLLMI